MARLARLSLPGHLHWLTQRGHGGCTVFSDDADRALYAGLLREAAAGEQVRLHALSLAGSEVQLLATPPQPQSLSRMMQALGRRYVSAHHRRHGGSGTLWDGRFRCAVVEPGTTLLDALCLIDNLALAHGAPWADARRGAGLQSLLVDPPDYWQLGNTPFERQAAWQRRLQVGLSDSRVQALVSAARGGWVVGSPGFAAQVAAQASRRAVPRPRGRPRKAAPEG